MWITFNILFVHTNNKMYSHGLIFRFFRIRFGTADVVAETLFGKKTRTCFDIQKLKQLSTHTHLTAEKKRF